VSGLWSVIIIKNAFTVQGRNVITNFFTKITNILSRIIV